MKVSHRKGKYLPHGVLHRAIQLFACAGTPLSIVVFIIFIVVHVVRMIIPRGGVGQDLVSQSLFCQLPQI